MQFRISNVAYLFGIVVAVGIVIAAAISALVVDRVRVGGSLYENIAQGKDLVAEVLPPPLYIIEPYLEINLAMRATKPWSDTRDHLKTLREEYNEHLLRWKKSGLPGDVKLDFLDKSDRHAQEFWNVIDSDLLPAIANDNPAMAADAYNKLTAAYIAHRAAISDIVSTAKRHNASLEVVAEKQLGSAFLMVAVILGALLLAIALGVLLINRLALMPLEKITSVLTALAKDPNVDVPYTERGDEIGDIANATKVFKQAVLARSEMEKRLLQSQKLEAVGQLTGGIAHDFNNLLLVIIGNLDLLRETAGKTAAVRDLIESSLTAALAGSELSNSLLSFSRQSIGKYETVDIKTVVQGQVRLLKRAVGRKITLEEVMADDIQLITVDAVQLRCAVTNLVINARDAMPDGGKITIRTYNAKLTERDVGAEDGLVPGDYAVVEVSDTGVGIPSENLQRIFDPFFTTKEVGKGTGLGLSMVYGFVKATKGAIKVDSKVRKGTTFRLFFPRAVSLPEVAAPPVAAIDLATLASARKTILVVDDDDLVRASVIAQMQSLGYDTLEANGPAKALEILLSSKKRIDLLFSDIVMPGPIDGVQLANLVNERYPDLTIMLSTGYSDLKSSHSRDEVRWSILRKPYRRMDLQQALRDVFGSANDIRATPVLN